ncbi:hypothetical protein CYLTODRAFT_427214 [Cylindrobasidium torrendii FP15055 ss-10]|uniref:F-box domain-containing protein n=1 Tax=Cylindrobasidium torrendii FP15055 ss-10 TaxID=1314674 RepID=A0A0D7AXM8_9AGAR|nr:hypothetical protein CYLTODRAFT_427214 [Cylindrobasidium torrendii FP15055 ss-10]
MAVSRHSTPLRRSNAVVYRRSSRCFSWPAALQLNKALPPVPPSPPTPISRKRPTLPQEVIAATLQFISSDQRTLKAAALASRTFRAAAQALVLAKISLKLIHADVNPYLAFQAVIKSGRLSNYVRELTLHDMFMELSDKSWLAHDTKLAPRIVASLPHLTSLTILAHGEISTPLGEVLTNGTLARRLRKLVVRGFKLNVQGLLRRCTVLRELEMSDMELTGTGAPASPGQDITSCHPTVLIPSFTTASLSRLRIQLTPTTHKSFVGDLLRDSVHRSLANLELFDIDILHFPYPDAIQQLLSNMHSKSLRIRAYHTSSLGFDIPSTSAPCVTYTFRTAVLAPHTPKFVDIFQPLSRLAVEQLQLELELSDTFSLFERQDWEWEWLDDVLVRASCRATVKIVLQVPWEVEHELMEGMQGRIIQCLPRTRGAETLSVSVGCVSTC